MQFRELEFALGLKDPAMLARLDCLARGGARALARRALAAAVRGRLRVRRGFACGRRGLRPAASSARSGGSRPWSACLRESRRTTPTCSRSAEVLIEIDECLALWRAHHVQMVERMIGAKRGTGGSDGVGLPATTLPKRAFPDLWRVRTHIGEEPEA